jgi:hypothetical protein
LFKFFRKNGAPPELLNYISKYGNYIKKSKFFEKADQPEPNVVMLSRHPLDIVRMSDYSGEWESCHTPGHSYFQCAVNEMFGAGFIAYVLTPKVYNKIKDNLQEEDIFHDPDRGSREEKHLGSTQQKWAYPIGRLRIRRLSFKKSDSNEIVNLATPEKRAYGNADANALHDQITQFLYPLQKEQTDEFLKLLKYMKQRGKIENIPVIDASRINLVGGTYQDTDVRYLLFNYLKQLKLLSKDDLKQKEFSSSSFSSSSGGILSINPKDLADIEVIEQQLQQTLRSHSLSDLKKQEK